jgi:hypothetical protein
MSTPELYARNWLRRAGQAVDLVDHDNIDPAVPDGVADPLGRFGRHASLSGRLRRPKKQGPDLRLPVTANAIGKWL